MRRSSYDVYFEGRIHGSIGKFHNLVITVAADDRESAAAAVNDEFEYNKIFGMFRTCPPGIKGKIMPRNPDSRQQPKSLAHKMLEAHVAAGPTRRITRRKRTLWFLRDDAFEGTLVVDAKTGKQWGKILPTVSAEVLAASPGIQGWSKPAPKPAVRWEHEGSLGDVYTS